MRFHKRADDYRTFNPDEENLYEFIFGVSEDTQPLPIIEDTEPSHFSYVPDEAAGTRVFHWSETERAETASKPLDIDSFEGGYVEEVAAEFKKNIPEKTETSFSYASRPNTPAIASDEDESDDDYFGFLSRYVKDAEFYSYEGNVSTKNQEEDDPVLESLFEGSVIVDCSSRKRYKVESPTRMGEPVRFEDFDSAREQILSSDISVRSKLLLLDALEESLEDF